MSDMKTAVALVEKAFKGKEDIGGTPYKYHCWEVMMRCLRKGYDGDILLIAILHDIIGDTLVSHEDLVNLGFSYRVRMGIKSISKVPSESYDDYIKRVLMNQDAMLVKVEDLDHNMDINRIRVVTPRDIKRVSKYQKTLDTINQRLEDLDHASFSYFY